MTYDNNNTFILFVNDKGDNPKRPDRTGTINVGGVEYKLSGWLATEKDGTKKLDKNGNQFLKGRVEPKDESEKPAAQAKKAVAAIDDFDDEIPF